MKEAVCRSEAGGLSFVIRDRQEPRPEPVQSMDPPWAKKFCVGVLVACGLVFVGILLKGSAVSQPPTQAYCWEAAPGAVTATTIDLTAASTLGPTASILICNDEAAAGASVYCTTNGATPAAPGASGGRSWVIKATEKINIDGRYTTLKLLSSSGTISVRVLASY